MRQLATIRKIIDIQPIPEADAIEVVTIDGWQCVVKKDENFKVGDLVIYIEIDSIVPERPEFEFLRIRKFRVRTIKLKGQVSQGLVLPLSYLGKKKVKEGDDVTDRLDIIKYDPETEKEKASTKRGPLLTFMMRFKWFRRIFVKHRVFDNFPSWIKKTDETRIQNLVTLFNTERDAGTEFEVTEKLDGQSATYAQKDKFLVCSRNIDLTAQPMHNGAYWPVARQFEIEKVLNSLKSKFSLVHLALQGEVLGEGIQGNKYKIKGYDLYAHKLILDNRAFSTEEMTELLIAYGIKSVPLVATNYKLPATIQDLIEFSRGKSALAPIHREGIVLRNEEKGISFKVINPDFLLKEDKD